MATLFECWNGGTVQWDQVRPPQFVFGFPPANNEVVVFFQLSGRICEILTNSEWHLNMGGQLFDIPNLPANEIHAFMNNIQNTMGYVATPVPYQYNTFTGVIHLQLSLWVNMVTGRADIYNPLNGLMHGQQLLMPQNQFNMPMPPQGFGMTLTQSGGVEGNGVKGLLTTFVKAAGKGAGTAVTAFIISGLTDE